MTMPSQQPLFSPISLRQSLVLPSLGLLLGASSWADTPSASLETLKVEEEVLDARTNPRADAAAPYKVNQLASPKYSRPVADTPKSLAVISKDAMEDARQDSLAEVMRAQPGITLGTGEGGNAFGDRFIIRGFEARNDVFIDGLRDPGVGSRQTFAVEQVEVAKGPSSSFAGRGTTGGAINLVSKQPTADMFTQLDLGTGQDDYQRYSLDDNSRWQTLGLRTNLLYSKRQLAGRGLADEERKGLALAGQWQPTTALSLSADHYYQASDDTPDGGVAWDALLQAPVPGRDYFGQIGRDFWRTHANINTLKAQWAISPQLQWHTSLRAGETRNQYVISINGLAAQPALPAGQPVGLSSPGVFVRANSQNRNQTNQSHSLQSAITWEHTWGGLAHSWVMGVEWADEDITNLPYRDSLRSANAGLPGRVDNYFWQRNGGRLEVNTAGYSQLQVRSQSAYLLDTLRLHPNWELFAGLRRDTYDFAVNAGATAYANPTQGAKTLEDGFINGHLGLVWALHEDGNLYASLASSSNPTGEQLDAATNCAYGGLCQNGSNAGAASGFTPKPERNKNLELGSKWELFDEALLLTGALFELRKSDVISTTQNAGVTFVNQIGELRVRGLEFSASGNPSPQLSLQGGIALLDTEILRSDTPSEIGQPFPNTAETSAHLQARYSLSQPWALGGVITYKGEIAGGTPNGGVTGNRIDANSRLDLFTEYRINSTYSLQLNLKNATDEIYYDALYRSAAPFTYIGEGRSLIASISIRLD
jgi:catecholate siderophore receptor